MTRTQPPPVSAVFCGCYECRDGNDPHACRSNIRDHDPSECGDDPGGCRTTTVHYIDTEPFRVCDACAPFAQLIEITVTRTEQVVVVAPPGATREGDPGFDALMEAAAIRCDWEGIEEQIDVEPRAACGVIPVGQRNPEQCPACGSAYAATSIEASCPACGAQIATDFYFESDDVGWVRDWRDCADRESRR